MAGLCEGGNEPPLKAKVTRSIDRLENFRAPSTKAVLGQLEIRIILYRFCAQANTVLHFPALLVTGRDMQRGRQATKSPSEAPSALDRPPWICGKLAVGDPAAEPTPLPTGGVAYTSDRWPDGRGQVFQPMTTQVTTVQPMTGQLSTVIKPQVSIILGYAIERELAKSHEAGNPILSQKSVGRLEGKRSLGQSAAEQRLEPVYIRPVADQPSTFDIRSNIRP
ncbi:hypothetical protein ANN_21027 [Periplaneta americana]|uniref:Uncharacterized protein n=1 Tax=Periplaneta americana TaxID=6978 RepID=A0ABQ8SEJ2_PERAM|nr:hypothetical protein ANN_21027 [Periplaneta americana]